MDKLQAVHDYYEGLHKRIKYNIYTIEDDMYFHVPFIDINSLRDISRIRSKRNFPKLYLSFSPADLATALIHLTTNAIQYKVTTKKYQAIGYLNRRKTKRIPM